MPAFFTFISENLEYPPLAKQNQVSGRVFASFIIEENGDLTDAKIFMGIGFGCDEEVLRVLKKSPKWKPGYEDGRPVRVQYTVPIAFNMNEAVPQKTNIH